MKIRAIHPELLPYAELAFFRGWSKADLSRLNRLAEVVEYEPGEVVCSQGRLAHEFLVVAVGRADLLDGRTRLGSFGPGDTIGETALLAGAERPAAVVAQTYLKALYLGPREFHGLLLEAPSFGRGLSLVLARRLSGLPVAV